MYLPAIILQRHCYIFTLVHDSHIVIDVAIRWRHNISFNCQTALNHLYELSAHDLHDLWEPIILQNLLVGLSQEPFFVCSIALSYLWFWSEHVHNSLSDCLLLLERQVLFQEILDLNVVNMVFLIVLVCLVKLIPYFILILDVFLGVHFWRL